MNRHLFGIDTPATLMTRPPFYFTFLLLKSQSLTHLAGVLGHDSIGNDQRGHALNNRHGTGHDTGIVAALGGQDTLARGIVAGGGLVLADGGRGLEGDPEEDGHAVGDATLDAARVVGLGLQAGAGDARLLSSGIEGRGGDEGVVVDAAEHLGAVEAGANLKALDCGDRHHGVGEGGLELVEAGLAEANGGVADDAGDGAASAVVLVAQFGNAVLHAAAGVFVRTADREEFVNLGLGDGLGEAEEGRVRAHAVSVVEELDVANGGDKGDNVNAVGLLEPLLSNSACSNTGDRLAGTAAAATRAGLDAVLLEVGPVSMAGARKEVDGLVAVVLGALVLVGDSEEDGRAE